MKFRSKFLLFLVVCAIGFVASLAFAKAGGIKVSDTSVSCGDPTKETNQLFAFGSAKLWLNNVATDTPYYTITCKKGQTSNTTSCLQVSPSSCGDSDPNYEFFFFPTTGDTDVKCTLTVWTDSSCTQNVSQDTWLQ